MRVTELKPRTSRRALLQAANHMQPQEFNRFWEELRVLRARRLRPHPDDNERAILARIRKPFPSELKRRMRKLTAKMEADTLTAQESAWLRDLAFRREEWHAERMQALVDLANLRMATLDEVMTELGMRLLENA